MADWRCTRCNWVNRDWAAECNSCGADRENSAAEATATAAAPTPSPVAGTPTTGMPTGGAATPPLAPAASIGAGLVGGLVVGTLAAAVATAVWYLVVALTEYEIGFVAVGVGWLVGTGVVFGARGSVSFPLVVASGLLTLAALSVSQYLIVYHFLTQEVGLAFGLLEAPEFVIEVALDVIREDPLTLLFWGLALVYAVYIPFRRMRPAGGDQSAELPA